MKKLTLLLGVLLVGGLLYAQDVVRDFTVTIPQAEKDDLIRYIVEFENYRPDLPNPNYCPQDQFDLGQCSPLNTNEWISNPESEQQFAIRLIGERFQELLRTRYYIPGKVKDASDAAQGTAEADALNITVQ